MRLLVLTLIVSSLCGHPATTRNHPSESPCDALRTVAKSLKIDASIYGSMCAVSMPKTECTTASLEVLKKCLNGIHVDSVCLEEVNTNLTEVSMDDKDCFCGGLVKFSEMLTSVEALLCGGEDEGRTGKLEAGGVTLEDFKKLNDQIKSLSTKIEELSTKIEENQESITESLHGQWCAYQYYLQSPSSVISYDSIFFEDSNINNNALNEGTGVFTAPRAGVYLATFSYMGGNNPGQQTVVYLHHNGARLAETRHQTRYSKDASGWVNSTGGRAVYQRLEAGDTLTLQTGEPGDTVTTTGPMSHFMFCVQFINN